jgi:bifunctional non-homologous end joining protein LigD
MPPFEFLIPTTGTKVPSGPDWLHEIKYDGYRLRVERNGDRVRLITRGGYDWANRYPWIVEAALKNRQKHFVIDGEAVILGVDGYSDWNALYAGKHNEEVQLCAFDVLAMDGDDLRDLPLSMRKTNLARLLARHGTGRTGVEAPRPAISGGTVKALGQGEESAASCDEAGDGFVDFFAFASQ